MKNGMMKMAFAGSLLMMSAGLVPALAQDAHKGHDMSMMNAAGATGPVPVSAVIHKVDATKGMVNVTHDPIPSLKWPTMTMDLPVTKRVDLSNVKVGAKVVLSLKQGRDKRYRIIAIEPAK